jgi:ABC-type transport system involved in multi-copper enzyme maturation permease subunit
MDKSLKHYPVNIGSIFTITANVFREAIRDRTLYLVAVYAIVLVAAVGLLPEVSASTENKITLDVSLAAMNLLGLVVTVFLGTGLINKEIDKRTVLVLLSKPIRRGELIVGKFLGLSAVIAVLVAFMQGILMLVLGLSQIPYPLGSLLVAALFLFFQLSVVTTVAILFGVLTSSILATILTFCIYIMGNLTRDLLQLGDISQNVAIERLAMGLYLLLPDLARLDLKNDAVYGIAALPNFGTLVFDALYAVVYIVLLLSISIAIFSKREF